ncbi:glycogen debranching enzyme [Moniliophthora roreri]|nr:glycogen debranching enzyme [Moniliophthora roreri]
MWSVRNHRKLANYSNSAQLLFLPFHHHLLTPSYSYHSPPSIAHHDGGDAISSDPLVLNDSDRILRSEIEDSNARDNMMSC